MQRMSFRIAQNPIFVVGYPRSGTTLLQALLATQGNLVTFPETHFFSTVFHENSEFRETIDKDLIERLLAEISQKSGIVFSADITASLKRAEDFDSVSIKDFFERVILTLFPEESGPACRWLEKTPDHGLCLEHIYRFYPEAKFIGIVRNPLFSIKSRTRYFAPRTKNVLQELSSQWVQHLERFEQFQETNPYSAFLIKYENLTRNPEEVIARVCQFLQIEFQPEKLEKYQEKANNIIQPFEYWKKDVKDSRIYTRDGEAQGLFSLRDVLKIQYIVLEKMKQYGYEPQRPILQSIYNLLA